MDALDAVEIARRLGVPGVAVRVMARCGSTNAELLARAFEGGDRQLLAAEEQTAGRGRRGRRWRSAAGAGATFSVLARFARPPAALSGLSLAVGVAAARGLRALGLSQLALKWPNDLYAAGAKLGGILVETRQQDARTAAVIGIGINCRASPGLAARLRRRIAYLDDFVHPPPARNLIIAAVAREVLAAAAAFERSGLAAFAEEWRMLHADEGRRLRVRLADGRVVSGVAAGVAASGALRLRTRAGLREVASGSVLREHAA